MVAVQYLILGVALGAVFALLAVGIVLVYRASGVLNFAHASIAMASAFVNFELLERLAWLPVGGALVLAMAFGALLAVAAQRIVFARVATASQVAKLIVSFGLAGVVQGLVGLVWSHLGTPEPRGRTLFAIDHGITLGGVGVPYQRVAVIVLAGVATIALALLVQRTSFGVQLRALAQNPMAARLAGVDDRRIETIAWALAGASAALVGVLQLPFVVVNTLALSGYQLKALAAALLGGFVSLPAALLGGLGLGVGQELVGGAPAPLNGLSTVLAPALVLVLLVLRVERFFVSDQEARAVEGDARTFLGAVRVPFIGAAPGWLAGTGAVIALTFTLSGFWTFVATRTALYALLALSLVVLTGWSGQVSLMPGTFAGVGACLAWVFGARLGFEIWLAVPLAALATVPLCGLVGLAALRLRPLYLAVGTVAFAGLFEETLFQQRWFANGGVNMAVTRPGWLAGDHAYAAAVLAVVGVLFAFTATIGRSRTGRALRMVRDNPRAAEAGGVNPVKYRLVAFALSAFYAGAAGALFAYLLQSFSSQAFGFLVLSLAAIGLATIGGIRSPLGAVVGAFLWVWLTEVFRTSGSIGDLGTIGVGAGIVAVMVWSPDGLVGLAQRLGAPRPTDDDAPAGDDVIALTGGLADGELVVREAAGV